jgi:hypothetical protein
MAGIAAEIGLSIGFTLMALIPLMQQPRNVDPKIRVQIKVGLEGVGGNEQQREDAYSAISYGGNTPNFVLFNALGDRIAWYWNRSGEKRIEHNAHGEIFADYFPGKEGQTPEYLTMSASWDDAICITHGELRVFSLLWDYANTFILPVVQVTKGNSGESWGFVPGEIASECEGHGKDWLWCISKASLIIKNGDTEEEVRPKCLGSTVAVKHILLSCLSKPCPSTCLTSKKTIRNGKTGRTTYIRCVPRAQELKPTNISRRNSVRKFWIRRRTPRGLNCRTMSAQGVTQIGFIQSRKMTLS